MSPPRANRQGGRRGNIALGIVRLARGRAEGFAEFGASPDAFLASLAPLLAFAVVGALLDLVQGDVHQTLFSLLISICMLLGPPVVTHALARLWSREGLWLRYATAANWCQWAVPVVLLGLLIGSGITAQFGVSDDAAGAGVMIGGMAYVLWLSWFLARRGLALGRWRAALLVAAAELGTALAVVAVIWVTHPGAATPQILAAPFG